MHNYSILMFITLFLMNVYYDILTPDHIFSVYSRIEEDIPNPIGWNKGCYMNVWKTEDFKGQLFHYSISACAIDGFIYQTNWLIKFKGQCFIFSSASQESTLYKSCSLFRSPESLRWPSAIWIGVRHRASSFNIFFSRTTGPTLTKFGI